jgi:hypothetical protein
MSLADLKPGTFRTTSLNAMILRELNALEIQAKADDEAGRLLQAKKKRWLAEGVREYMRLTDNELNGTRNYLRTLTEKR